MVTRASAKKKGSSFERDVADHAAAVLDDDRIDRRVKSGAADKGDIGGLRSAFGERIVVEAKNTSRMELGKWMSEVEAEKANDGAPIGVVVHKRVRYGEKRIGGNFVTMTLDDFLRLVGGKPKTKTEGE
jgi:hypothetical protein